MVDVDKLSDAELRTKLLEFGFPVMPITGTTRKVMAKKLKMLLENKNKIGSDGRRSLGRYSSEEDSDSEVKIAKKKDNRRATMAAPIMQPPSVTTRRKSTRLNDTEVEASHSPPRREVKTTTSSTSTRTHKILQSAQDEFDTGSDSESDILTNSYNKGNDLDYKRSSPLKSSLTSSYSSSTANRYSPPKPIDASYSSSRNISFPTNTSPSRLTSYNSPSLASEYASDRLNQIRSRLSLNSSGYDKPLYSPPPVVEKEETPFLSNFTKRLSAMTSQKNDYDYKNDIIKEHDTNGSGYVRSQLSSYRAARGRDTTYDYKSNQNSILKNNFVSFAVLAGAALFFIFLAIMYLGMRSDTSVIPAGKTNPYSSQ